MSRSRVAALVVVGAALSLTGCPSDDSEQGLEGIQADIASTLQQAFAKTPILMDGLERLIVAVAGGPADGVTITPTGNGFSAVVQVDLDNDGTRETGLNGTAVGAFEDAPTFVGFNATGYGESANATVINNGSNLEVFDVGGTFPAPPLGIETIITEGDFDIDLETGGLSGTIEIEVLNDADPVGATVHIEPTGEGGFRLRVTGRNDSFEFFVPVRAAPALHASR